MKGCKEKEQKEGGIYRKVTHEEIEGHGKAHDCVILKFSPWPFFLPPSLPHLRVIPRDHHLHPPKQMLFVMLPLVSDQLRGGGGGYALG